MVKVPVAIKPWTHNFKIVDHIQWIATRHILPSSRACIVRSWFLLQQEAIESTVTRRDHIADFHLLGQGFQAEPDLFGLAVQVYIRIDLLFTLDVLLLDRLLVVLIYHLARPRVNLDSFQAAKDHDVVILYSERVHIAQFFGQTYLEEAPQVQISVELLYAVVEIGPSVSTPSTENVYILLVKSAAPWIDSFNIH